MDVTNWHVITGAPGTGKTTLIGMLADLGYTTIPEAAKAVIDDGLAQGQTLDQIRGDEYAWQAAIRKRHMLHQANVHTDQLAFFDRSAHDNLAHLRYYQLQPGAEWDDIKTSNPYKTVFLLEPLDDVAQAYFRTEDIHFSRKITSIMEDVYREAGANPIRLPAMPPAERLAFILSHLGLK